MAASKKSSKSSKSSKKSAKDVELATARSTIKKLRRTVDKLEKNVSKLEKRTSELKAEAKERQSLAKRTVKKAKDSGGATAKSARKVVDSVLRQDAPPAEPALATEVVAVDEAPAADLTVAQLRAAARQQGVPGYSRMRKAQLIAALA
ncbi:Rho termination factor N-terminal domain-containing protein [Aeromicrobium sp.]|uniref:Rho termination factor N-terminal domain-containing protein n=1 Tax=Aeromicrobium sp. TaxID=1871063 RepID=UPI0030C1C312